MKKIGFDPRLPTVTFSEQYLRLLTLRLNEVLQSIANAINLGSDGFLFSKTVPTGNYTVQKSDQIVLVNNSANCTITLPAASDVVDKRFTVKKISNNAFTVTVVAASGNIDNATSQVIGVAYTSLDFASDGTGYWII